MNILFIVSRPLEINSSASLRNINTINGLSDLGHCITVVTSEARIEHSGYSKVDLRPNVSRIYIPVSIEKQVSARMSSNKLLNRVKRLVYRFIVERSIYDTWKGIINSTTWDSIDYSKFDILITSADPKSSHLVGEKIKEKSQLPWIQIWGDPFTGDITSFGKNEHNKAVEEKRLLETADKVCYLSELTCEIMKANYPMQSHKMFFMPRPYVEGKYYDCKIEGQVSLSYCGDYNSRVRNILPLYEAVKEIGDFLTICGNSDIELDSTERITVNKRVSVQKVEEIESEADILVHLSNASGYQIPGKIYNYSATNKPILFILDGDCERIENCFEKYNRYIFCRNNISDIISAINTIKNGNSHVKYQPVEEFAASNVLSELVNIEGL